MVHLTFYNKFPICIKQEKSMFNNYLIRTVFPKFITICKMFIGIKVWEQRACKVGGMLVWCTNKHKHNVLFYILCEIHKNKYKRRQISNKRLDTRYYLININIFEAVASFIFDSINLVLQNCIQTKNQYCQYTFYILLVRKHYLLENGASRFM